MELLLISDYIKSVGRDYHLSCTMWVMCVYIRFSFAMRCSKLNLTESPNSIVVNRRIYPKKSEI